ncbi:MAG: hypothetical protein Tsb0034_01130 [Ekhidna sp.]
MDPSSLSEVAAEAGLTTLLDAVQAAGLTGALESESAITVFAPSNEAFAALLTSLGVNSLSELIDALGASRVSDILQYHVVASTAFSADLTDGQTLETLAGQTLTVNVGGDGSVTISDVSGNTFNVTTADVEIANGVVHVIDGVLLSTPTVADVAFANGLTILLDALEITGLTETLLSQSDMTVFAPTNEAFEALLGVIGQSSLDDVPVSVLTRVLQYHVVGSSLLSSDLSDGATAGTLLTNEGVAEEVTVGISGSDVSINDANVTAADVEIVNGVVHVIDAVLVPSLESSIVNTVVEPAYFNKDFSILTEAVVSADLLNTLIDPQADLTVFAPNNAAFEAANITSLDGISTARLTEILQYHVLGSEVKKAALPATGSAVTTLNGDFYLSINDNGVFINGLTEVTNTDLDYENGVVHVIDRTLVPAEDDIIQIAVAASEATEGAEFGQLVAALTAVSENTADDLITTLKGVGPFTVFAPTDAAFQALYDAVTDQDDDGDADIDDLVSAAGGLGTISTVLQYHVYSGRVFSTDIPNLLGSTSSVSITAVAGGSWTLNDDLTITPTDGALSLGLDDASIVDTDILATNGVIHVIDQVILP